MCYILMPKQTITVDRLKCIVYHTSNFALGIWPGTEKVASSFVQWSTMDLPDIALQLSVYSNERQVIKAQIKLRGH